MANKIWRGSLPRLIQGQYAQKYSNEEQRTWEDLRHGIFLGTEKFVEKIKKRYLPNKPHEEVPHQKQVIKDAPFHSEQLAGEKHTFTWNQKRSGTIAETSR